MLSTFSQGSETISSFRWKKNEAWHNLCKAALRACLQALFSLSSVLHPASWAIPAWGKLWLSTRWYLLTF